MLEGLAEREELTFLIFKFTLAIPTPGTESLKYDVND